jgi:hypothetical protein
MSDGVSDAYRERRRTHAWLVSKGWIRDNTVPSHIQWRDPFDSSRIYWTTHAWLVSKGWIRDNTVPSHIQWRDPFDSSRIYWTTQAAAIQYEREQTVSDIMGS